MKKFLLTISLLFYINLSFAQTKVNNNLLFPNYILGVSSTLNSSSIVSFGFSRSKIKTDVGSSDPNNLLSFNLSPKIGLFVNTKSAFGMDLFVASSKNDTESSNLIGGGPFYRYYPNFFNYTFLELNTGLAHLAERPDRVHSSSVYSSTYTSVGLSAGTGLPISKKINFELSVEYKHETLKPIDDNYVNSITITDSFGIKFGLIAYLQ